MLNSPQSILEKIRLGEDSTFELKEALPKRDELADSIAAFANSRGGVIIVGVSDSRQIIGLSNLDAAEKKVIEICSDSIDPPVNIWTEKVSLPDESGEERPLLKIEAPRSLFVHKTRHGYFQRQGSSKREMPTEALARLLQSRSQARIIRFDEQAVPNSSLSSMQRELYLRFVREESIGALQKRRLLVREDDHYSASVAGILICSALPEEHIYNSFIQAVFYQSLQKDANYQIDAKDFKQSLDRQIIDAYKFVEKYNEVSAIKKIGRQERPQYSMKAVFEALVNAVVHRDYSKHGSKIRLFMFSDRLELYSPGALPNSLTVENMAQNQSTRNELLARLLSELTIEESVGKAAERTYFLERRGEGVGIILDESEKLSGKRPVYEMFGEELRLTLFAAKSLQEDR